MITEERLKVIENIPSASYIVERAKGVLKDYKREVKFAFLFGSFARGEADNWSDVDIKEDILSYVDRLVELTKEG